MSQKISVELSTLVNIMVKYIFSPLLLEQHDGDHKPLNPIANAGGQLTWFDMK